MKPLKKRSVAWKLVTSAMIVAAVIGASYLVYYLVNYTFNKEYKKYIVGTTYKEGKEFKALSDSDKPEALSDDFVLAADSDSLKLYLNQVTTEVAVYDKRSGRITYSNPQNIEGTDYKNGSYLSDMKSQITLKYYKSKTAAKTDDMNSYDLCTNVQKKNESDADPEPQFMFEALTDENGKTNGVRVIYTIGDLSNTNGTVPLYISESRFEKILDDLKKYDEANKTTYQREFKNRFTKSKKKSGFYQRNSGVKISGIRQLQSILDLIGWSEQDYATEMEKSGEEVVLPISFKIPLEYTLENDRLTANIVTDKIVETGGASLYSMQVLPYFGAVYYTSDVDAGMKLNLDGFNEEAATANEITIDENSIVLNDDNTINLNADLVKDSVHYDYVVYETAIDENEEVVKGEEVRKSSSVEEKIEIEAGKSYIVTLTRYTMQGPLDSIDINFSIETIKENADGYFLVPNGSGSLIKFNSINCDGANDYIEHVYGTDEIMADAELSVGETTGVKLPVYGIADNNAGSLLVILSRGESFANIKVQTANDVSCKDEKATSLCNYNSIKSEYVLRVANEVVMGSSDHFVTWNKKLFDTELTQTYCFLDDKNSGYSGMASYYRNYLEEKGDLTKLEANENKNIGMFVDFIGAVKGDSSFLGFSYEAVIPMTTFKQAKNIVETLNNNGVENIIVNYQGWMNDGYNHDTVEDISVISKLGGKSDFASLCKYLEQHGGKLYGDMSISRISYDAEDFKYNQESSRIYGSGFIASYGKTSPTNYSNAASVGYMGNLFSIVSPKFYPKYIDSALDEMKDIKATGISFRDFGTYLNSDMKKTNIIHREHTKEIITGLLDKVEKSKNDAMFNSALAYTFKYADDIINAPIGDNNYVYVDTEVPFYEMVLHGYINYSGSAINLAPDTTAEINILQCIEYGACPHFTFTNNPATDMKYTTLNSMYATCYKNWMDEAVAIYADVNAGLSKVKNASVVSHEILDPGTYKVRKITYDNGVSFIVNYSNSDFNYNGKTLPANDWLVEE